MKLVVDTPSGKGILLKKYRKNGEYFFQVMFTQKTYVVKHGKKVVDRKPNVRVYPASKCTIRKADSHFTKWLKKLFKRWEH